MTTKDAKTPDTRLSALKILLNVLPGANPQRSLSQLMGESAADQAKDLKPSASAQQPEGATHPFTQVLVYGVCRYYQILTNLTTKYLDKPLKSKDRDISIILLIGCYQILFTQKPQHAVLNTTAELANKRGKKWATGLVNAILRKILKDKESLLIEAGDFQKAYPSWLLAYLEEHYDPQERLHICQNGLIPGPMTLRWNPLALPKPDFKAALENAGIKADWHDRLENCLTLEQPVAVSALPLFFEGSCSVQDEAAQWAAELLQPAAGEIVLDACSAPGGKCSHLLEKYPTIAVTALDISEQRLQQVEENLSRLKLQAQLMCADAAQINDWCQQDKTFDHILLDAPCSGSGVIRRHPDILWLRRPDDIQALAQQQARLLRSLWKTLKPGGNLLYCTCSILPDENEFIIRDFIADTPDGRILSLPASQLSAHCIVSQNPALSSLGIQLLPTAKRHDGFYYALLQKTASQQIQT